MKSDLSSLSCLQIMSFSCSEANICANPLLFIITGCSASMKLPSPMAVVHSADILGVSCDVSADRATWLSEASLLSAQEQLHTPEEQSAASESRRGCSSSSRCVQVHCRAVVALQVVLFSSSLPYFWLLHWIDWLGWSSDFVHQKFLDINIYNRIGMRGHNSILQGTRQLHILVLCLASPASCTETSCGPLTSWAQVFSLLCFIPRLSSCMAFCTVNNLNTASRGTRLNCFSEEDLGW